MRLVLDEGVPRQLVGALRAAGLDADPFDRAWAGLSNGKLIGKIEIAGYDVLLTNDRNIAAQQSIAGKQVAIVALAFNRRRDVLEHVDEIVQAIRQARPGQHVVMRSDRVRGKITD